MGNHVNKIKKNQWRGRSRGVKTRLITLLEKLGIDDEKNRYDGFGIHRIL